MKIAIRIFVFYLFMWLFLLLLGGLQQETGFLPPAIGLAQLAPGLAGLLMLLIFRKDNQKITFFNRKTSPVFYLIAFLLPVISGVLIFYFSSLIINGGIDLSLSDEASPLLFFWMPIGALGEETGWRGYLHKRLAPHMRGIMSSILVGLLWVPMHIHFLGNGPVFICFFALLLISYSVVIFALAGNSGFNVLLAAIFHFAVNIANMLSFRFINDTRFMIVSAVVWLVIAAGVVVKRQAQFLSKSGN